MSLANVSCNTLYKICLLEIFMQHTLETFQEMLKALLKWPIFLLLSVHLPILLKCCGYLSLLRLGIENCRGSVIDIRRIHMSAEWLTLSFIVHMYACAFASMHILVYLLSEGEVRWGLMQGQHNPSPNAFLMSPVCVRLCCGLPFPSAHLSIVNVHVSSTWQQYLC